MKHPYSPISMPIFFIIPSPGLSIIHARTGSPQVAICAKLRMLFAHCEYAEAGLWRRDVFRVFHVFHIFPVIHVFPRHARRPKETTEWSSSRDARVCMMITVLLTDLLIACYLLLFSVFFPNN